MFSGVFIYSMQASRGLARHSRLVPWNGGTSCLPTYIQHSLVLLLLLLLGPLKNRPARSGAQI